ncbi:phage major tail tube protein [Caulobacter sp. RL271]|uniref:Phage major tail tube protein n=1 Tax=Caulobacter segnis TaxID=88688 RepID=A0ABY4ZWM6_9CAUL|nr:phage major tail tube protein [Caulobacter segnis]USQ97238.1 phage major tail tube protein [Caulobacter segnis]
MASSLYFMEAANLFVGDHDPTASLHLVLESLKLPGLEETTQEWTPGGAVAGVEVGMSVLKKLDAGFKLKGVQPEILTQFGLGSKRRQNFTAYGSIRDKLTGASLQSKAILEARMTKVEADEFKRGELQGYDYALTEVFHYELTIGGREIYYFDFMTSAWRVGGVSQNSDVMANLGIA